jgi:hypothetical protein
MMVRDKYHLEKNVTSSTISIIKAAIDFQKQGGVKGPATTELRIVLTPRC